MEVHELQGGRMSWPVLLVLLCLTLFAVWVLLVLIDDFGDDQ